MAQLTLFPLQYQRQDAVPIDIDQVFSTTSGRTTYLSSPRRYAGQIVSDLQSQQGYMLSADKTTWLPLTSTFSTSGITLDLVLSNGNTTTRNAVMGDLSLQNLFVAGTATTVNSEVVLVKDNILTLNYGESGSTVTNRYSGIEIDRGTGTDYQFLYDEFYTTFRVGEVGSLQSVATREDSPINTGFARWNSSINRFDTFTGSTLSSFGFSSGDTLFSNVYQPLENQRLSTGNSASFNGLTLTGHNPLIVNKTTLDSSGAVQANQIGLNVGTVINMIQMSINNTENKTITFYFRSASLPPGQPSNVDVIIDMPAAGGSMALLSDITTALLAYLPLSGGLLSGNLTGTTLYMNSYIKIGGTSAQFLKANGSIDSNIYITGYTETDTLQNVTSRGTVTTNNIDIKSPGNFRLLDTGGTLQFTISLTTGNTLNILNSTGGTIFNIDQNGNVKATTFTEF